MRKANYPLYEIRDISNYLELINYAAEKYGNNICFTFKRDEQMIDVSYQEFRDDVMVMAGSLIKDNIRNMMVGVLCDNDYLNVVAYFAFTITGNAVALLNSDTDQKTMNNMLNNCEPKWILYKQGNRAKTVIQNEHPDINFVAFDELEKRIEIGKSKLEDYCKEVENIKIDNTKLSTIIYTSGTTSSPKGVMITQRGLINNAKGIAGNVLYHTSTLMGLPFYHIFSWCCLIIPPMMYGINIFINESPQYISQDIALANPVTVAFVPAMARYYYRLIKKEISYSKDAEYLTMLLDGDDILQKPYEERRKIFAEVIACLGTRLEYIICGAAVLEKEINEFFEKVGIRVLVVYGLTEFSAVATIERNEYYRHGSVGIPTYCTEVKIHDPDAEGYGEVYLKGDPMLGYYKQEEASRNMFDGEWLKSGDVGRVDEDGFLYITGRIKNLIILSNGENVAAEEIESYVYRIQGVKEVMAYGENDVIVAEVFAENQSDELKEYIQSQIIEFNASLPAFKKIGKIKFRDTIFPQTATKKNIRYRREA